MACKNNSSVVTDAHTLARELPKIMYIKLDFVPDELLSLNIAIPQENHQIEHQVVEQN